jgi:hypothetical protein
MLTVARRIFAEHPSRKYMGFAANAMVIRVPGSLGADAEFVERMLIRVLLIMLAILYIAWALAVMDSHLFNAIRTGARHE